MHGTEGEVYANPQRCPQINLIDREGMRVLYEKQDTAGSELLPQAKDPETTAQWIERCLAGSEPIPESLKIQDGLLPGGTGEAATISDGWRALIRHFNSFSQPDEPCHPAFTPPQYEIPASLLTFPRPACSIKIQQTHNINRS